MLLHFPKFINLFLFRVNINYHMSIFNFLSFLVWFENSFYIFFSKGLREVLQNGTLWFPPFNARDYNAQIHEQEYRSDLF